MRRQQPVRHKEFSR